MSSRAEKFSAGIGLFILILSLLPVMYLGRYNHPTGDDYYYGAETRAVWETTGNIGAVLAQAARGTVSQYHNWQGTYSAMFLMYLPPNVFGEWAYHLLTCLLLLCFSGGVFCLTKTIMCTFLQSSKSTWVIIASLLTLVCVQTVPSQGETFFWYNGSMYYTGFFSVTLLFAGIILKYLSEPRRWHLPVLIVLALFIAGGNYVSLLPMMILLVGLSVYLFLRRSKRRAGVGIVLAVTILGFAISALAPGNAVRQEGMWKIPAWKAILKSLLQGILYMRAWTGIWLIAALLVAAPFLWKAYSAVSFRFPCPVLVILVAYGIFCSMSCPLFYTMNSTGPARAVAIVYYGYILYVFFCYGYVLGFLHRKMKKQYSPVSKRIWKICVAAGTLLLILWAGWRDGRQLTVCKAVTLLSNGEAAAYEREYQNRMQVLTDNSIKDVVFDSYEHRPDMLYVGDFTADAQHETNVKAAEYFHKYSIRVEY